MGEIYLNQFICFNFPNPFPTRVGGGGCGDVEFGRLRVGHLVNNLIPDGEGKRLFLRAMKK